MNKPDLCLVGILLCLLASVSRPVRADDLTTLAGVTYSNIVVQSFDRHGLFIEHDGGSARVLFKDIHPELRGHYKSRSQLPVATDRLAGEQEEPPGPQDLATLSGEIYRNVVVKEVGRDTLRIGHDTGLATVYFAVIPPALHEKYRKEMPVQPDPPPDADDLVTTYGQIFRNIKITRVEPDGLTFHHDGGVTKLWFPSLPEELRREHGYDPVVAWKYQREMAAASRPPPEEQPQPDVSAVPANIEIHSIETKKLPDDNFWVRFSVRNLTDEARVIRIIPCEKSMAAIMSGKTVNIPAGAESAMQQIVVPMIQPRYLKINSGAYQTNCVLNW
ncbi:MAG: hypothetical protein KBC66_04975 [Kiritimatiellae bacterium]|jgi:hypothetical protein|nr:hypothetical protein [Kiritimatiellia bacterium]NLD90609.1 hypothetical protein [Lentisphaerota bacterium]HOU22438.1 hypothetical protein [Kiritimatiellia bacterium]HPC19395.1 hypothetical protein [Kiritimatiellia bacterium]HQN80874.1 hypothetical protein [Kiritimatiellia bacterium]